MPAGGRPGSLFRVAFDLGLFWFKGQKMGNGQCPAKAGNRHQAPEGYQHFHARDLGWTKVVLASAA